MSDPRGLLTADAATWAGYAFMLGATLKLVHVAPEICADIYRGVTAAMQFGVLVVLFLGTMVYVRWLAPSKGTSPTGATFDLISDFKFSSYLISDYT